MLHLSQSKIAIAVAGNFAFALALCTYKFMIKVCSIFCFHVHDYMLGRAADRCRDC